MFGDVRASGPASAGTLGGMAAQRAGERDPSAPAGPVPNTGTSASIGWAQPGFDWQGFFQGFQGLQTPAGSVGRSGAAPAVPSGPAMPSGQGDQYAQVLASFLNAVSGMMKQAQTPAKALRAPGGR